MNELDKYKSDFDYMSLVLDILDNSKFQKTNTCRHHGLTRYEHSLRVSYYSYVLAKKLRLDYKSVARAGLLHDFFITEDLKESYRKISAFVHPYIALTNACKYFELNEMEKDIIITHMFPTLPHKVPKYLESWLVRLVDKVVATYEFYYSYAAPRIYKVSNLYIFLLIFMKW